MSTAVLAVSGCAYHGLNSLPLPGAVGRDSSAVSYRVEIANIATLEPNSPVMVSNVVVGSVSAVRFVNWHAEVDVAVQPTTVVPANAVATIGQTSLLGSMHLALDPPLGQPASGRLTPGATIALARSSTYPTTEQTLSSLAAVVNGGGLGQIGDIIHNANLMVHGREGDLRELLDRMNSLVGVLDSQRDSIVGAITALNRLAGAFANHRDVLDRTLQKLPAALDVLVREQPKFITALDKLRSFSDSAVRVVNATQDDLITNLRNLEPTLRALADVGPYLDTALAYATVYPFGQNLIDRGLHGDYMNLFAVLDLTVPRLKRTLFLGTRWGDPNAQLEPAPGEPYYRRYSYDPLNAPLSAQVSAPDAQAPMPTVTDPVVPFSPPRFGAPEQPPAPQTPQQVFAGPYGPPPNHESPPEEGHG
ncbi:MCE family protein [Mycobacterium sp. DL440]|uniref:MCE family protein n=1 Tax=Mycobacterium sp. DL440 TaxID=2675523 RepID=UPI001FBA8033|nr:MCE family protein [Mycobacterium sp. DL440]